jgi:uncharacterized protein
MQPLITVLTLGVDDLEKSLRFYRDGLGFAIQGIVGEQFGPCSATEVTLGHNVRSRAEVDTVMAKAHAAGAAIVSGLQPAIGSSSVSS